MDALEIMFGKKSIADKIAESKSVGSENCKTASVQASRTKRSNTVVEKEKDHKTKAACLSGVKTTQIKNADSVKDDLCRRYIAFDTETTGFSAYNDRIIELGAVLFENGKAVKSFGTLVNAGKAVPPAASRVNHITNDMLKSAPSEKEVYPQFVKFLGDAINGETIICAHNASFDMRFLAATFERLGIDANIRFVDTLAICKKCVTCTTDHKQPTMAQHFNINQKDAHRAESDALVCGLIMDNLLKIM